MWNRREILGAAMLPMLTGPVWAQAWPKKVVRIIVPLPAGGPTDAYARVIAKGLGDHFNQTFIVENKAGADTMIGTQAAALSPADGYTLLFCAGSTFASNPFLYRKVPYSTEDFAPISLVGTSRFTLTINADLPVRTIQEFVKYVKDRPGQVAMATLGRASWGHITGKLFQKAYGLDMIDVQYKGSAEANNALIGGTVALYPDGISGVLPLHKAGRVRIIGVTSKTRSPDLPGVPTMVELGFPDFIVGNFFALYAPAGTPADIVRELNAAMVKIVAGNDFRTRLLSNGITPESSTPAALAALIAEATELSRKQVAVLKLEPE